MRTFLWLSAFTAAVLLLSPARTWTQQNDQPSPQSQTPSQTEERPLAQQESVADAARRARERKKEAPRNVKTFTNDNLPTAGGISTVGGTAGAPSASASTADATGKGAAGPTPNDEKAWRGRFQALHRKLEQDQANLDVMQRELAQLNVQYYDDPNKAMQQGYTRGDINDKTADIDKMQAQVDADRRAIADAEDELRKSGGDPGWAR
jgi:hypothetical protein